MRFIYSHRKQCVLHSEAWYLGGLPARVLILAWSEPPPAALMLAQCQHKVHSGCELTSSSDTDVMTIIPSFSHHLTDICNQARTLRSRGGRSRIVTLTRSHEPVNISSWAAYFILFSRQTNSGLNYYNSLPPKVPLFDLLGWSVKFWIPSLETNLCYHDVVQQIFKYFPHFTSRLVQTRCEMRLVCIKANFPISFRCIKKHPFIF